MAARLGDYVRIKTGKLDANASDPDGAYPFFTCSQEPLRIASFSYDCECVLVAGNGDLNVKYYHGKFDAYQRTYIIESADKLKLDVRYLFHFMSVYVGQLRLMSIGGVIKYIKLGNLTEARIPLPPLSEQRRIADILDRADALRAKRRDALAQLDTLAQAIFLDLFGDPVLNTKGWPLKKFGDIGMLDRGVSRHRPRNAPELLGGPHPLVQTGEIANCDGYIRSHNSSYSDLGLRQSKMWPAGTLCITIAANIAKTGILTFDACFPDSVVGFRAEDPATIEFVRTWLSFLQQAIEDSAPESAQKNINLAILRNLDIPLPPLTLQREFAHCIAAIEELKTVHRTSLTELDALFAALQHRAFRGEL
jgi:type I restriction enzyme S subunit